MNAGDITGTLNISVRGDNQVELNETLDVLLSNLQASGGSWQRFWMGHHA